MLEHELVAVLSIDLGEVRDAGVVPAGGETPAADVLLHFPPEALADAVADAGYG